MSAIGGIINFDGGPVDQPTLLSLGQNLDIYGPDGGEDVRLDSIGMVYRAFHTNLESHSEKQPLVETDGCVLAWDGRLDNRQELMDFLRDDLRGDRSDSALVMSAYNKWGIPCLEKIIGDFAFALWNPASKNLYLARDAVGTRSLFYHVNRERLIWSSRLESLLSLPNVDPAVDDEYVAGYLTMRPKQGHSPYRNIYAVPPGNVVITRAGRTCSQRFWNLNPNKEIRYRTDQEYEEHFRELFREAVRTRLRVAGPTWADLSGGLDSSSIVCVADTILKQETVQTDRLETLSAVFDESPTSDERRFINLVEERRGQIGHHFKEGEYPLLVDPVANGFRAIPNPLELWTEYHQGVRAKMRAQGARVLLSGSGGDELLTAASDPYPELADLLVQRRFTDLHQRLQTWSLALKRPYLEVLLSNTVIPALPRRLQRLFRRRERARSLSLLQPGFIKRFDLHDKLLGPRDIFGCRLPSSRGQATAFLSATDLISSGYLHAWGPIEISYPFTHRPLVEFLQAIPPTQWIRPGETRSLQRRALRTYLPPQIAARKGKGNPAEATLRAVAREWPRLRELLKNPIVCTRGYVDPAALQTLLERPNFERAPEGLVVIRLSYLELWLRDLENRLVQRTLAIKSPSLTVSRHQEVAQAFR